MSSKELIESLRRSGEGTILTILHEAEQEAEAVKAAASRTIADLQKKYAEELETFTEAEQRRARSEAEGRALRMRLDAENKLSDALFSIARFSLHQLRDDRYVDMFGRLVRELPALPWKIVSVNARDAELARKHFPDARIDAVGHIAGGFEVSLADESLRIVNTFEKRLERLWPLVLPQMVRELEQELNDGPSSAAG